MKLVYTTATLATGILLVACAAQPEPTNTAQLQQVEVATQRLGQTADAKTVALTGTAARTASATNSGVVCRRVRPTGSYISKRQCLTREDWQLQAEQAQEWMRTDGISGSVSEVH